MPGQIQTRPNPELLLQTDAPAKEVPLMNADPAPFVGGLLVPRNYDTKPVTDSACFAMMFQAIENQRLEVSSRMDEYKWNNEMARAIERLKNATQIAIDKDIGSDPNKTTTLPSDVARYMWDNNLQIDGVFPRKYASFEEFAGQKYSAAQLRTAIGSLDIKKTEYTDMNSQYMQQTNIALSLLQVVQQLLTSLIDMVKRIKEQITSKV